MEEMKADVTAVTEESISTVSPAIHVTQQTIDQPLFDEIYEDWASFDAAIARATAAYHPIRKRSSLTFEVYNRTVSKGRHDRKNIAEFLSKTFKCTHGIKFRSRGSGKRMRHKLRDIGCPFHVYASAVEFGPTYRIKVRMHDKHNHPIGPDSMKMMSGALHESDYELAASNRDTETIEITTTNTMDHVIPSEESVEAAQTAYETQAQAEAEAQSQVYEIAQAQALLKVEVQTMTGAQVHARAQAILQSQHNHTHSQSQSVDTSDILSSSGHDNESLGVLDGAMDSSMRDEVLSGTSAAQMSAAESAVAANSSIQAARFNSVPGPPKFEETMTLEALRKRVADFADERDWNQVHTPRNLLLALNSEVGELCKIFQWKGEAKNTEDWSARDKEHLGEEISDVLIYLVRLADKCDVDLPAVLNDKIAKNARKYPAELIRGSSKKYNEYKRMRIVEESTL
ncbi:unnamed protein product [Peronospora destructor]|uniref:dCTP pyrophosphatase 1 n=1 Tax=Peronospora destructor TaxID=86335 RepID=A0AAV0URS8_9STRA|nr:unnamed protein product [Peronospora destructor]